MPETKPLHFEQPQASELDFFAAQQAARTTEKDLDEALHDPIWPGETLREAAQAPQIFPARRSTWLDEPFEAKNVAVHPEKAKEAPRVPRNTEPCSLAEFIGICLSGGFTALVVLAAGGFAIKTALEWIGLQ